MLDEFTVLDGMAAWEQTAFVLSFTAVAIGLVWNLWIVRLARRNARSTGEGDHPDEGGGTVTTLTEADFSWVFFVPALNEEVTIGDSVERLLQVRCTHRHIVVIDDGSTDRTPDVLGEIGHRDLTVLRRDKPDAQLGKADALNDAWRRLPSMIVDRGGDYDPMRTIVCVVDADGRLDADAPAHVLHHFVDDRVGGVQVRVRIYNRTTLLTRAQDIEFGVYGLLYQAARSELGTAGMGGNGQFNRLATLDSVAGDNESGPWRNKLTEDQDIGLRMLEAGWRCGQENSVEVNQQGVNNLRRLLRQRTRWAQGNVQAMAHLRRIPSYELPWRARLDAMWALLQPVAASVVGFGVFAACWAFVTGGVGPIPGSLAILVVFILFGFGGVVLGVAVRSGRGPKGWLLGLVVGVCYSAYTWLLWPALARAVWRQFRAKSTWAKTERESIDSTEP